MGTGFDLMVFNAAPPVCESSCKARVSEKALVMENFGHFIWLVLSGGYALGTPAKTRRLHLISPLRRQRLAKRQKTFLPH